MLDDSAHRRLLTLKPFDDPPGRGMVVTDEIEEHIVPPFTEVVGTKIVVHGGFNVIYWQEEEGIDHATNK